MRKWQPGADKLRNDVWLDVQNMVPTPVGTYHTMPTFSTATVTGGQSGTANYVTYYCWTTRTVAGTAVTYVAGETSSGSGNFYVETLSGTTLTNRSVGGTHFGTGVTGANVAFGQMGNTTLFSFNDAGTYGIYTRDASGSSNFALSSVTYGASIIAVQSNIACYYNLCDSGTVKADYWMTSGIAAPTTFTGEAVLPTQLLHTPGEITAAVPFGGSNIVFKRHGVYRHTYVGGTVKWTMELLRPDIGVKSKHAVIDTGDSLVFLGEQGVWEFDGAVFRKLSDGMTNPVFDFFSTYASCTASQYFPKAGICAWYTSTGALFYSKTTGQFGRGTFYDSSATALTGYVPCVGKADAVTDAGLQSAGGMPFFDAMFLINVSAAKLRQGDSSWKGGQSASVTGSYLGDYQKDFTVRRIIPMLRNTYYTFAGNVAATGLSLTSPYSATSSTARRRFDGFYTVQYPEGSPVTISNVSGSGGNGAWEIDDYIVESTVTGAT